MVSSQLSLLEVYEITIGKHRSPFHHLTRELGFRNERVGKVSDVIEPLCHPCLSIKVTEQDVNFLMVNLACLDMTAW